MFRFLKERKQITCYDSNSLCDFERKIFREVLAQRQHNIGFISLKAQLEALLSFSGSVVKGVPNAFVREFERRSIVLRQQRYIGANFGFVSNLFEENMCIPFYTEYGWSGSIVFTVAQCVSEIRSNFSLNQIPGGLLPEPTLKSGYPLYDRIEVLALPHCDQREYWNMISNSLNDLTPIASELKLILENGEFRKNVIVPYIFTYQQKEVCGVILAKCYRALLRLSNGIRLNDLVIFGTHHFTNQIRGAQKDKLYVLGEDNHFEYGLAIESAVMQEKLYSRRKDWGEWTIHNKSLLQLCVEKIVR